MTDFAPDRWITRFASSIHSVICKQGSPKSHLRWRKVSKNSTHFVLSVSDGVETYAIKAFDPSDASARLAARREFVVTSKLQSSGLGPHLIAYSNPNCYLVRSWISGRSVSEHVDKDNIKEIAERIGQFCAAFGKTMPSEEFNLNWGEYLRLNDIAGDDLCNLEINKFRIADIEIGSRRIAVNDASLDNFVLAKEGGIKALDFEASALKPAEWDLLLFARVFVRRFPTMVAVVCTALADGYIDGNGGGSIPHECLAGFLTAFGKATASKSKPISRHERDHQVIHAPFMPQTLAVVTDEERSDLEAHILREISKVSSSYQSEKEEKEWQDNTSPILAAICTNCGGKCCADGLERKAFIKGRDLRDILKREPNLDPGELASYLTGMIPEQHIAGSCLFSVPGGCALPRSRRARICNQYLCGLTREVAESSDQIDSTQKTTIVSRSSSGEIRTRTFSRTVQASLKVT